MIFLINAYHILKNQWFKIIELVLIQHKRNSRSQILFQFYRYIEIYNS